MKKTLDLSLYLVLDPDLCGGAEGMIRTTLAAIQGGVTVVQLRAPTWKKRAVSECARELLRRMPASVPLIINDHADVARAVGAAGVHVGQKDLSPEDCRLIVGPDAVVGLSISNVDELSRLIVDERSRIAPKDDMSRPVVDELSRISRDDELSRPAVDDVSRVSPAVDYIGIGPVFPTGTKKDAAPVVGLDGLRRLLGNAPVPAVAIGGISEVNARSVYETGVQGIAVVSAICGKNDPEVAARALLASRPKL